MSGEYPGEVFFDRGLSVDLAAVEADQTPLLGEEVREAHRVLSVPALDELGVHASRVIQTH